MEMAAIAAHVPLRVAVRIQLPVVAGIPPRAAVGIQVPIVAVVDIQLRATAVVAGIQRPVGEGADTQLPVAAEVAVDSTPPAVTTRLIADDKNLKYFRAAPQAAPFFCLSESRLREARQRDSRLLRQK
jgi:hypothetical protein